MAHKAPGKHYRKGISLVELFEMFPDNATAEQWFAEARWPEGIRCAYCDSENVNANASHKTMPYRCNTCKKRFSVKANSLMHASNISYQKWAIAVYLVTTSLKGVSSMKLRRDLKVSQKTPWFMLHRIRKFYSQTNAPFDGEVEVDEGYFGGEEGNRHYHKKKNLGRGTAGKVAVVGMKDRETNQVRAEVVPETNKPTLQGFVIENTTEDTTVITDEFPSYKGVPRHHIALKKSSGQYLKEQAHTNGIESFWAMLKRAYNGTYHHMSPKHLQRYIDGFEGRHNDRPLNTIEQMENMVQGMADKRLRYRDLIAGGPAYPQEVGF